MYPPLGACLELVSLPGGTEKIHRHSCVTFEPTRSARPGILKSRVTRTLRWAVNSPKFLVNSKALNGPLSMQGHYVGRSRAGVVGMVTSYETDDPELESRYEQEIFASLRRPDSLWGHSFSWGKVDISC